MGEGSCTLGAFLHSVPTAPQEQASSSVTKVNTHTHRVVALPVGAQNSPMAPRGTGAPGGMFARRAPGACPARYLCIKYPISSPKFIPS